jgi:hypothetical protein
MLLTLSPWVLSPSWVSLRFLFQLSQKIYMKEVREGRNPIKYLTRKTEQKKDARANGIYLYLCKRQKNNYIFVIYNFLLFIIFFGYLQRSIDAFLIWFF